MSNLRSILAGYDFSDCADAALAQAARIAVRHGAPLRVLHVIDSLVIDDLAQTSEDTAEEIREEITAHAAAGLATAVDRVTAGAVRPDDVVFDVAVGVPIDVILDRVETHRIDLVVLGVYGAGGPHNRPGTLATRCVRKVPARVLLVTESAPKKFQRIVACVDFSDTSQAAVEIAARTASRSGSVLHLLHVFSGPWHRLHYRSPTPEASPDYQRQYMAALEARLEKLLAPYADELRDNECHHSLLDRQSHGRGISEYAREHHADLVVLGTRGRSNLRYVLLGSTAERVIRETECSILAVKPSGFSIER